MKTVDYTKVKINPLATTRNLRDFDKETDNIYETVVILSKRANQLANELKDEFQDKVQDFSTSSDLLDEILENREQIELAKFYEQLPKPSILAVHEFENDMIFYKNPEK
jgi:predicted transcriptional regulator